jgi:ABC-type uncharacterized transport system permease subunit
MVRLFAFLSALLITSAGAWLSSRGAESFLLFVQAHPIPKRFGHLAVVISIFAGWVPIMIAMKSGRGRSDLDEDVSLTPRVRRAPFGLREL